MDVDGRRARRGRVDAALLSELLEDDFLARPPPKSTGRERYGAEQAAQLYRASRAGGRSAADLVATLVAFTAAAVAQAMDVHLPPASGALRVLVGGGGARNPAVMEALGQVLPAVGVERFDAAGVPADAAEAMAFSLMGRNAILGLPNHLPRCTGARRAAVLGEFVPGRSGLRLGELASPSV